MKVIIVANEKEIQKDVSYEKVKEKLVGNTIWYHPALQDIFSDLIKCDNIDTQLQPLLLEKLSFYEKYMVKYGHLNLRTFQFYLSKIGTLFQEISNLNGVGKEEFLKYIIEYSFKVCVCYKNNTLEQIWNGNQEHAIRFVETANKKKEDGNLDHAIRFTETADTESDLRFRFVEEYVTKSFLDPNKIQKMLTVYVDDYLKKHVEELNVLADLTHEWYLLDDLTVEAKINKIIAALNQDKFTVKEYPRIISLFVQLEQIGFSSEFTENMLSAMKRNIKNLKNNVRIGKEYGMLQEGEKKIRNNIILADIQKEIDQYFHMHLLDTLTSYLDQEDHWAEHLREYVSKNNTEICYGYGFLTHFDVSSLVEKIGKSKSYDIDAFRECIRSLYVKASMGYISTTKYPLAVEKKNLVALKKGLEAIDSSPFDNIKRMQITYLLSELKDAIEAIS